jgi:hypothetical protein
MGDDDMRAELQRRMARAVADEDFEQAARLRDQIKALHAKDLGQGTMFKRQVPGRMGLGTDQQVVFQPPEGWKPPKKPDLGVTNSKPRRGGR